MVPTAKPSKKRAIIITVIVFVVLMCIPVALTKMYQQTSDAITAQVTTEQTTLVDLTTQAVKIKLDNLVGIASSMASSSALSSDVAHGQWTNAADAARDMQNNVKYYDPFIDRIIIYDSQGTQQAAYPALVGGLGTSAVSSSWYKALSSGSVASYVTNVTLRTSMPQIQVVSIVVPVKTNGGVITGFLVLQIPTDNFLQFGENISLGTYGFAYIVDPVGNLVADPKYSSESGTAINYSFDSAVKNVIKGERGTEVVNEGTGVKGLVAYGQVPGYGWGVIGQELYQEAFAGTANILSDIVLLIVVATLFNILLAYMLFRILSSEPFLPSFPSGKDHE
jgi:hypothetical protein